MLHGYWVFYLALLAQRGGKQELSYGDTCCTTRFFFFFSSFKYANKGSSKLEIITENKRERDSKKFQGTENCFSTVGTSTTSLKLDNPQNGTINENRN